MRGWRALAGGSVLLATAAAAGGYAVLGSKWDVSPVVMHLELGDTSGLIDGAASWDDVAAAALSTWNSYLLRLQFVPVIDSKTPRDHDRANNIFFSDTIYGTSFDDAVAVTTEWDVPGDRAIRTEADVIFNSALRWNSYRGALQNTGTGETLYDLRRVALHEFGHVVGLDHPDSVGQTVSAVMNSHISNTDSLRPDDIRGGQFLYGAQPGTYVADLATIERPKRRKSSSHRTRYRFFGQADPNFVQRVFLSNSRIGFSRLYKAKGLARWRLSMTLKPGRNIVSLYVRGTDGVQEKIARRVIRVAASD